MLFLAAGRHLLAGIAAAFAGASLALAVVAGVILGGILPAGGLLRNVRTGGVLGSPLLMGVIAFIFVGGLLAGIAYGAGARTFRSTSDVVAVMTKSMETMGSYRNRCCCYCASGICIRTARFRLANGHSAM